MYVTEEDIRTLVNVGAEQRVIEEEERELIHSVMAFGDTIVREVMKPRPEMVAVSVTDPARRVLDVVIAEGYSKLPVFQESKDDIVGVVHDRELLVALANGSLANTPLRTLMRVAVHVPESKKIAELLREMQRDKFSMAIVVDEYGGTAGLVTMEDLLEEIVGEIRDEHDEDEQEAIHVVSEGEAIVDAGTNIEDVNARLHTNIPTEDFETIGGYTVGLLRPAAFRRRRNRSQTLLPPARRTHARPSDLSRAHFYQRHSRAQRRRGTRRRNLAPIRRAGSSYAAGNSARPIAFLTLLTTERGKLDAVAKGVRRSGSHLAGRLEFGNECDLSMHRGRSLDVIVAAEIVSAPWIDLVRPERFAVASLAVELIDAFCEPDLAVPDIYSLLVGTLQAVARFRRSAIGHSAIFLTAAGNARARAPVR